MEQDLITGVRFMGAASMIIIALIVALVNRGKIRSAVYERSRWFICIASMLLGIHNLIQFFGHFREESVTLCWAINLAFYVVITPLYNMGELNLLRAGRRMKRRYLHSLLFILLCYLILGVGIATDTIVNDQAPWCTATFVVAVCFSIKILELSKNLSDEMKVTSARLTDDDLDESHQALRYTAKSMNWVILLSLATPWVGMSPSFLLNAIFGLVIISLLLWFVIKFTLFGNDMAALIDVTDEIFEASIIEEEKIVSQNDNASSPVNDNIRIEQWIASRSYADPNITIKDALDQMGVTATALNSYLQQNTNVRGYRQWLPYLRIEEAKRIMLEYPEQSIQSIAEACGYSNNSNFTRAFKAQEGLAPSAWVAEKRDSATK